MNKILCLFLSFSLLSFSLHAETPKVTKEELRFWKRLDKRLNRQVKKVKKHLKKKSAGEIQIALARLEKKDKLANKYNIADSFQKPTGSALERYAYYSTEDFKMHFKQAIIAKINAAGSFEVYLNTTQVSKKAFWCRVKRGALRSTGILLTAVGIAGAIGAGIILNSFLMNPVVYMNPLSWSLLGMFFGAPAPAYLSLRGAANKVCPGE